MSKPQERFEFTVQIKRKDVNPFSLTIGGMSYKLGKDDFDHDIDVIECSDLVALFNYSNIIENDIIQKALDVAKAEAFRHEEDLTTNLNQE